MFFCVIVLREFGKIFLIMQRNMLHCLRVDESNATTYKNIREQY